MRRLKHSPEQVSTMIADKTTKPDKITPKESALIAAYTDIDNKTTFLNGTQSALAVYDTTDTKTASVISSRLLAKDKIRHRVDRILDALGFGEKVRLEVLTEIGLGKYKKRTTQTRLDADGAVKDTIVTESTPGADSIVRVNDILNKLTGKYETAKQASRIVSKTMQSMIDRITSQASAAEQPKKVKQVKDT